MFNAVLKLFGLDGPPPPQKKRRRPAPRPSVAPSPVRDNGATATTPGWSREAAMAALRQGHRESPLPISTACRRWAWDNLPADKQRQVSMGTLGRRDPAKAAREALGAERIGYLRCLLAQGIPLPRLRPDLEGIEPHEGLFVRHLDRVLREDLDGWEGGIRRHDALVAEARADGLQEPERLVVPLDVELALTRRATERLEAAQKRARRSGGGGTSDGGGGPVNKPSEPAPPAGPQR